MPVATTFDDIAAVRLVCDQAHLQSSVHLARLGAKLRSSMGMIWDYWLLILVVEFATTAGAAWLLMALLPTRRVFLVALLSGLLLPTLIVGIPFILMNLPNAGGGEGMLFAACGVWALLSLPICLGASMTVFVFSRRDSVS